jgi:hypothetical protein
MDDCRIDVRNGGYYIIFKNQTHEKALKIFEIIESANCWFETKELIEESEKIEKLKNFTLDMINCKFEYYNNNGKCLRSDSTLLNLFCTNSIIIINNFNVINYLIDIGADLSYDYNDYKFGKSCSRISLLGNLEQILLHEECKNKVKDIIYKIKQNSEVPNKRRII